MPADDPYRTLGLERGASLDEVKRAYRRLVKANHPDAAGEAALPRFLAIQDAYDRIVGPDDRNGHAARRRSPTSPWEADPDRAGATYRAYGGRPRPRPGTRTGPRRPSRPAGSTPPKDAGGAGSTGSAGQASAGPADGAASGSARPPDGGQSADANERRRKKATLGSTSYDDVDPEAFSPDWGGASWYGTTSGTYWTLNPKEYADPRKHGPEYQARARRAGRGRSGGTAREAPRTGSDPAPPEATIADDTPPGSTPPRSSPPPTHTTSSWWDATAGEPTTSTGAAGATGAARAARAAGAAGAAGAATSSNAPPRATPEPPHPGGTPPVHDYAAGDLSTDAVFASIRRWLDDDHPTGVARIGRAVIGWAPVALGAGWLAGEVSGCGRFAATCPPIVDPITWVVQLSALLLLILLPRLARITTIGTLAILGTVFPASLLLFATGDPEGMAFGRSLLGGLIIVAWLVGLGYGIVREVRRLSRPVS
ncbi:MAG TPA: DnaJ domain-containing protein [Candidatus Limnocylindrales bacterium]|nr:DnaJ domain-containing protein [Candidatus Limnocylindrales bacterium]